MNFYGVGVEPGGIKANDILPECLAKGIWYMDFKRGQRSNFEKIVENISEGDVIVAKAYATSAQRFYYVRAIGIVVNKKISNIEYSDKYGVDVVWIKHFYKPINLLAQKYKRGTFHTSTIFHEKNTDMIFKIKNMMRFDYIDEVKEN